MRESIAKSPIRISDQELQITVSIGVSRRDENTLALETLIARADQAMYVAKHKGRNQVAPVTALITGQSLKNGGTMSRAANRKDPAEEIDLEEAKFLWDEYRYRHDLIWKLIFQITTAVVAILIIPYIQTEITKSVGVWIVALPFLAIILVLFSMSRLKRELEILDRIRKAHRERQAKIHHIAWRSDGHFTRDVMLYLSGLILVSLADLMALIYIWHPA